jgi:hypothetical protein
MINENQVVGSTWRSHIFYCRSSSREKNFGPLIRKKSVAGQTLSLCVCVQYGTDARRIRRLRLRITYLVCIAARSSQRERETLWTTDAAGRKQKFNG